MSPDHTHPGPISRFPGTALLAVTTVLLAIAAICCSFLIDAPVERWILDSHGGHWSRTRTVELLSRFGDWPELMGAGLIGVLAARRARSGRWQRILLSAMIASTLSGLAVNASRLSTGRTRPRAAAEQGWYGPRHAGVWLVGKADFNSFPSGHTATAVGFAGVLLFAAPGWGVPAMLLAACIALSRMLLGAHHPSDVITAALISLAIAWLAWRLLGCRDRMDGNGAGED
jgi:membrane-associated phospholipid phosphatase